MRPLTLALTALLAAGPVAAQEPGPRERPLSLAEAVAAARTGNVDLAVAETQAAMARADADRAASFLWPGVDLGLGLVRSTDPVFAFGAKLRQARFAQSDLALDALNDPSPADDWATTLDVRWGVLSPTAWAGRAAASSASRAADWSAVRAREAADLRTRALYWGAVRATAAREAAVAAEEAARSTRDLFARREEKGLLTEADRLRAEAELAGATAGRLEAERAEREARRSLGIFLGWEADALPLPTDTLAAPPQAEPATFDPTARPDLRARAAVVEARHATALQANLSFLPAIDAFGQVAGHGRDALDPESSDWTVGLQLRWTAFAGFGRLAERGKAGAAERIARLEYDRARREAAAEVANADEAVRAAARGAEAALAARRAASTGADLIRRRFEEGLATATDVLQAEARRADTARRAVDALAGWRLAAARAEFVRSQSDPEDLP